jgi:hypothetical protein
MEETKTPEQKDLTGSMKKVATFPAPEGQPNEAAPAANKPFPLEQLLYNTTIKAMRDFHHAARRLEIAQRKVGSLTNVPEGISVNPEAQLKAAQELAAAVEAFNKLGQ